MSKSIYLRLAGPLQSWTGMKITGNVAHTNRFPTASGLKGLLAGALGYKRGSWEDWLDEVFFSVRQDRPGRVVDEFQTINPPYKEEMFRRRIIIAHNLRASDKSMSFTPDAQSGTAISKRTYLADSEFIVQITCADHTNDIAAALRDPTYSTYLGRKAFAPSFPFYLGIGPTKDFAKLPLFVTNSNFKERFATIKDYVPGQELAPRRQQFTTVGTREQWYASVKEKLQL